MEINNSDKTNTKKKKNTFKKNQDNGEDGDGDLNKKRRVNIMSSENNGFDNEKNQEVDEDEDDFVGGSELLEKVLIPVAIQRQLPIALKIGAHRQVNPDLKAGGDGVVTVDLSDLQTLLQRYPHVKFLATLLSKTNQHEACVLANKFRNLHIYGCWWYCNLPSIIREVTSMRVELLGFAFTAQHSDARVLEHLIYKWDHARVVIADVLVENFSKLVETGWEPNEIQIKREVERVLGGAYNEFMDK